MDSKLEEKIDGFSRKVDHLEIRLLEMKIIALEDKVSYLLNQINKVESLLQTVIASVLYNKN